MLRALMLGNRILLVCLIGSALLIAGIQSTRKNLVINVSPNNYTGEEFIAPGTGLTRAVYYPGEEIEVKIALVNDEGADELPLTAEDTAITKRFGFRWIVSPKHRLKATPVLLPEKLYRGLDIRPSAEIQQVTNLGPKQAITSSWKLSKTDESTLVPGTYEFGITYSPPTSILDRLRRSGQTLVVNGTSYRFEVRRPTTTEDQLEIRYRTAVRDYYLRGDRVRASAILRELLGLYPNAG